MIQDALVDGVGQRWDVQRSGEPPRMSAVAAGPEHTGQKDGHTPDNVNKNPS